MRIIKIGFGFLVPAAVGVFIIFRMAQMAKTDIDAEAFVYLLSVIALLVCGIVAGWQYPRNMLRGGILSGLACGGCFCGGILFLLPEKAFLIPALLTIPVAAGICTVGAAGGAVLRRVGELRRRETLKDRSAD